MNKFNFKKWAFRFTIWVLIINLTNFFLTVNYVDFPEIENNIGLTLFYFGALSIILTLLSVVFIVVSSIKKEDKNYQFWISVIGIVIFGIPLLMASFI